MNGTIYMLKFSKPIGNPNHRNGSAQFYLGFTTNLEKRLAYHRAGRGADITRAAVKQGCELQLVMVIPNVPAKLEQQLKAWKSHRRVLDRFPMYHVLRPVISKG